MISSPFSPPEYLDAIYAIPTQVMDSLILPAGNSQPALSKKAGQCSAVLSLPLDSPKRCNRSSKNLHHGIKCWTNVWEEIRKSQQEKEEKQE